MKEFIKQKQEEAEKSLKKELRHLLFEYENDNDTSRIANLLAKQDLLIAKTVKATLEEVVGDLEQITDKCHGGGNGKRLLMQLKGYYRDKLNEL